MRFVRALCSIALFSAPAFAAETIIFTYDALGRLVATSSTGTVNQGVTTSVGYDPAGNRGSYVVGTGGPPPLPPNQPPVAVNDSGGINRCSTGGSFGVVYNDYDPDGDTPLELIAVSGAMFGQASVMNSISVGYIPYGSNGTDVLTYTIRDTRGATAMGTLTIQVVTGDCGIEH